MSREDHLCLPLDKKMFFAPGWWLALFRWCSPHILPSLEGISVRILPWPHHHGLALLLFEFLPFYNSLCLGDAPPLLVSVRPPISLLRIVLPRTVTLFWEVQQPFMLSFSLTPWLPAWRLEVLWSKWVNYRYTCSYSDPRFDWFTLVSCL